MAEDLKRGDLVRHVNVPRSTGEVTRVSRRLGWADVRWTEGASEWVKRCPLRLLELRQAGA